MDKGLGFVAIILIWGGALYLFSGTLLRQSGRLGGDGFLASTLANFEEVFNTKKDIIGVFGADGDYEKSTVYFDKSVNIRGINVAPGNSNLVFAPSDDGLLVSNDGGSDWRIFSDAEHKINSGADVYKIVFAPDGNAYMSIFKNNQGILYRSRDNFLTVEKLFGMEGQAIYDFDLSGDEIYLGLSDGRIFIYSIAENSSRIVFSLPRAITGLKTGKQNMNLIYASVKEGGFYASENKGESFQRMKYLDKYRGASQINDFVVSPSNDYLVYAATDYGFIRSSDGGKTWQVFDSLPSEEREISSVYYDSASSKIYVSSNGKLYINGNGGLNWQILETGIGDRSISAIAPNNGKIIIGTSD